MAVSTKIIRGRIRSIGNTKKITKAMEMVSGVKMRKAVHAVLASRAYAETAWQTVLKLVGSVDPMQHPLLQPHEKNETIAIILLTSNRALCGGFNSHIINHALRYSGANGRNQLTQSWIVMGKKGGEAIVRHGKNVIAQFEKPDIVNGVSDVTALAKMVVDGYMSGEFDRVVVAYTDFVTPLTQKPRIKQLLPIEIAPDESLGSAEETFTETPSESAPNITASSVEYLFEPNPSIVLEQFLPRLVEIQLYQTVLESTASEHSARMMAMRNATDAAADMISQLTLMFNQARQAGITREIAEISGGKAALE